MLYSADFPEGFRAAISLRGFDLGKSRQPMSEGQRLDLSALSTVLQCLLADFGVVESPPGGCPPSRGEIDREQIARIAQQVIEDLRKQGAL
jgi:4-hydroxy-tetrahydrodipicolinate synthase